MISILGQSVPQWEWLICQRVLLLSRVTSAGGRHGLTRISWSPERATEVIKRQKHLFCDIRLREPGLFGLEKTPGGSHPCIWRENTGQNQALSLGARDRTGAVGTHWNHKRFPLNTGNIFLLWQWLSTGTGHSEGYGISLLAVIRSCLGLILGNCV